MQTHEQLKSYQREERHKWGQGLGIRVHRALSWLKRAEQEHENDDLDAEFIFLWISFNAAYVNTHTIEARSNTRENYTQFFTRLLEYDCDGYFYGLVWDHYTQAIRSLLNNKYLFQGYWDSINGITPEGAWQDSFKAAKRAANTALASQNTLTCLCIVMDRLYTLRNQLIHGGATWNGKLNRYQLRDATNFMRELMPLVIRFMMENGSAHWGDAVYIEKV